MWAVREISSSMVTPRFLAEDEGVTVADPRVIERSWEMGGFGRDEALFWRGSAGGGARSSRRRCL